MAREAYLGIDVGGTGAKAGVYDIDGVQLGFAQRGYQPVTDENGLTDIPIEDIYNAARDSAREAVAASGAKIKSLAVSSQGQTFVSLDENDQPLHKAILWYDARAGEQADKMKNAIDGGDMYPLLQAVASAPKIMWLRERFPETMSRSRRYLLLPDYIYYRLTGIAATDPCIGASSGLYSDTEPDYNDAALRASGITKDQVARIMPSGTAFSSLTESASEEWGINRDAMAVVGTNDQYAGALGAGNCRPGIVSETTGTCLALVTLTDRAPGEISRGLISGRFPIPDHWFVLAYSKTAGVALDWFVREFAGGMSHNQLDKLAQDVPQGSNGVSVLHHLDGFISPYLNEGARGHIHGLSMNSRLADVYNAFLESITFSSRQHVESYRLNGYSINEFRCIGGGAKSDLWMQMKADVLNIPVERPSVVEAATLGAAMIAAVGDGKFSTIKEASEALHKPGKLYHPNPVSVSAYDLAYGRYLELFERMY